LRRLEVRGLLVRTNTDSGMLSGPRKGFIRLRADEPHEGRANSAILTEAGKEAAKGLTNIGGVGVNGLSVTGEEGMKAGPPTWGSVGGPGHHGLQVHPEGTQR
jgi:hypothetical protein